MSADGIHPLRERLAAAKLAGQVLRYDEHHGYVFCTNEQSADRAMRPIAEWLHEEARGIRNDADPNSATSVSLAQVLADVLDSRADAIYPKGAHDGVVGD